MKQAADWMIRKRRGKCVCVHGTSVLTIKWEGSLCVMVFFAFMLQVWGLLCLTSFL